MMRDSDKTREQLLDELAILRERAAELEVAEAGRMRAEQTLQVSETRYQAILEDIEEGYYEVDIGGNFTFCNASLCRIFGYTEDELLGAHYRLIMDDENANSIYKIFNAVYRTGEAARGFDWEIIHKDETRRFVETSVTLSRNLDGEPVGFRGVVRDITERKRAEETLVQERNLLRVLIDTLPDYIFIKDTEGRFLLVNAQGVKGRGKKTLDEIVGKTDFDAISQERAERYFAQEQAIMRSGETVLNEEEWVIFQPSGEERWFLTSKAPFRDSEGQVAGLVGISRDITERKQAEEALVEERNLLRTLIDNMPNFINIKDTESRFVVANTATAHQLGAATLDEVLGKTDFDFHAPEMAEAYYAREQRIIQSGQPEINFEAFFVDQATGAERWALFSKVPLRDRHGVITGTVSIGHDITERKQAEEELRKLSQVVEQSPSVIMITDMAGVIEYVNPKFTEQTGYSVEEVVGQTPRILQSGEHPVEFYRQMWDAISNGEEWRGEFHNKKKDGELYWARTVIAPIRGADGSATHYVAVLEDVTERVQAEEALRRNEAQMRAIFDAIPDLIFVNNRDGVFLEYKAPHGVALVVPPEDFLGSRVQDVMPAMLAEQIMTHIERVLQSGEIQSFAYELLTEKDGLRYFDARLAATGEDDVVLSVVRDITERKQAAQREIDLRMERERVAILADFIRAASHEFRTPLSVVNTCIYLIKRVDDPEKRAEQLAILAEQMAYIKDLFEAMLTMTRLDSMAEFSFMPVNLNSVVGEVEVRTRTLIEEQQLSFVFDLDENLPLAQGDEPEINRALVHLISNAAQNTPPGGTISIRTYTSADSIVVEVADTGVGIGEADLPHIFDRFYRVDAARSTRGAGLGLSIAKKVIDVHQGSLEVDSVIGAGSVFRVALPAMVEQPDV